MFCCFSSDLLRMVVAFWSLLKIICIWLVWAQEGATPYSQMNSRQVIKDSLRWTLNRGFSDSVGDFCKISSISCIINFTTAGHDRSSGIGFSSDVMTAYIL